MSLLHLTADLSRAEARRLAKPIEVCDPVEHALHHVVLAVRALEAEVYRTDSYHRAKQIEERLRVELDLIDEAYEQARDRALMLKQVRGA